MLTLELVEQLLFALDNGLIGLMIVSVLLFIVSLSIHELGHILYFRKLGKSVSIKFCLKHKGFIVGNDYDYTDLLDDEYVALLSWGVLSGLVIILFGIMLLGESFAIMLLPYAAFCMSDIHNALSVKSFRKKFWEDD